MNNAEKIEVAKDLIRRVLPNVDASTAMSLNIVISLLDEVA